MKFIEDCHLHSHHKQRKILKKEIKKVLKSGCFVVIGDIFDSKGSKFEGKKK
jgi:hypothetical protein